MNPPMPAARLLLITLCFLSFFFISNAVFADVDGAKLFRSNCSRCHKLDKPSTGPALNGVFDRVPSEEWMYKWIKNNKALRESGDEYALKIYAENNETSMDLFPNLSDEEIAGILGYIKNPPLPPPPPPGEEKKDSSLVITLLGILAVVLLGIVLVLSKIVFNLNNLIRKKEGEALREPITLMKIVKNKKFAAAAAILIFVYVSNTTYHAAANLGRSKGYSPTQPIAFSHKVHAGDNSIDCKYCHFGVEKSKVAGIPSVNVCMNCHADITDYPGTMYNGRTGTQEIQKLLAAYENNQPIEWIKVHNLPDYVYFNHKQHVKIGGLECDNCHGDVASMDKLEQVENLSMGFCVNCHRKTEVNFEDNSYYSMFEELHQKMKDGEMDHVTAGDIGSTNCQRCHY